MSQSNYNIPNQSAPNVRAQLNAVFGSIATNNSGSTAPSTTFAYQWWYDTSTDILKQRNAANSAWINIGSFDQSGGTFTPAGQRDLASQAEAEAGTDNTKTMTPLRTKEAITAQVLSVTAGAGLGGVGTYAMLLREGASNNIVEGDTYAGSVLRYAGFGNGQTTAADSGAATGTYVTYGSVAPAGTWRAMGRSNVSGTQSLRSTLFLRIS
jgi:hypothetical protein